jgi:hypothetical protein
MSAEFARRASVEPTVEVSDQPVSEAAPLLSVDAHEEASEVASAEDLATEVVTTEVVSARDISAEIVSADDLGAEDLSADDPVAEVVTAEVAGADDASAAGTGRTTEPAEGSAVPTGHETLGASQFELPDFRPRRFGRGTFAVFVGCAAVLAASVAWNWSARRSEHSAAGVAGRMLERATEPAPTPPSPEPAPSSATPAANEATTSSVPTPKEPAGKSNEQATATVTVTVKAVPEAAVIFQAGKRLGTGVVRVSVVRKVKQRFTALLDGYAPSNFALDGSRDSVTIVLQRAQKRRVTTTGENDSPYDDDRTADTTAVAAPPATATPALERTADPALEPEVRSAETASE